MKPVKTETEMTILVFDEHGRQIFCGKSLTLALAIVRAFEKYGYQTHVGYSLNLEEKHETRQAR